MVQKFNINYIDYYVREIEDMMKTSFSASSFCFCSSSSATCLSASWLWNSSLSLKIELSNSWIRAYKNVRKNIVARCTSEILPSFTTSLGPVFPQQINLPLI